MMQALGDWLNAFLFREVRGSPVWGWLVILTIAGIATTAIIGMVFLGWEIPSRCNASTGDCYPDR